MTRRQVLSLTVLPAAAAAQREDRAQQTSQQNFTFIMADDLGVYDLGCYGGKLIRTPNIDRLAENGMRFNACYAGATVCAPSRSVLMTGQHLGHTTVRANASLRNGGRVALRADDFTIAEMPHLTTRCHANSRSGSAALAQRLPGSERVSAAAQLTRRSVYPRLVHQTKAVTSSCGWPALAQTVRPQGVEFVIHTSSAVTLREWSPARRSSSRRVDLPGWLMSVPAQEHASWTYPTFHR
jgi:Sulfatase